MTHQGRAGAGGVAARRVLRLVVAAGFGAMGVTHFVPGVARGMAAMIPPGARDRSPLSPAALVRLTGACELLGAAGLLVPATRRAAAGSLVVFLAAVFPANVHAARHPDRFGRIAVPVLPRAVLQVALAAAVAVAGR